MSLQVTTVMLAVEDLSRAKKFYWDGMGCANQGFSTVRVVQHG